MTKLQKPTPDITDIYEIAILVNLDFPREKKDLDEFVLLAESARLKVCAVIRGARETPNAKYFVGSGKVVEISETARAHDATVVVLNHALSPAQARNLEEQTGCKVIDRTELILDIFCQRARTFEGKLQVELAQLRHLSTRLVRGWTHLERQKGGIGLRGPGETQLETDRRLIKKRISTILQRLEQVRKQRAQGRRARQKVQLPTVALVGYTNAGKSSIFNWLTEASVYVKDQLFATLDPTLRKITLPGFGPVILTDTVGFIQELPHDLIESFRATLEEVTSADVLLHVIDVHDPDKTQKNQQVNAVLAQIQAEHQPIVLVYNKIDLLTDGVAHRERPNHAQDIAAVFVSAKQRLGADLLLATLRDALSQDLIHCCVILDINESKLHAHLYQIGAIVAEHSLPDGRFQLELCLARGLFQRLFAT